MVYKDGISNVMDKAFSIVIDFHLRLLKQCVGGEPDSKDPRFGLFAFFTSLEKRPLITYRRDFLSFLICPLKVRVGENSPNL